MIATFVAAHGATTAVIEYVSARDTRIVLLGADGVWGDVVVPSSSDAAALCADAGVEVVDGWDASATVGTPVGLRARMARRPTAR